MYRAEGTCTQPYGMGSVLESVMKRDPGMKNRPNDTPQALRERAEHAFRLAEGTTDTSAHDALLFYGQELLAEAERIESGADSA